jgi:putative flippase GtrA
MKHFLTQMVSFAGVGAVGTAAQYVILIVAVELFAAPAVATSVAGFVVGAFINYTLNYHFTFRSQKNHGETATKFFAIAAAGMLLNGAIMHLAIETADQHYVVSQLVATGTVFFWNFLANRFWTFRH